METYNIFDKECEYYLADDILKNHMEFKKGIKNTRTLVLCSRYTDQLTNHWIYARLNKRTNIWIESDGNAKSADKVFIEKDIIDNILNNTQPVRPTSTSSSVVRASDIRSVL